MLDLENTSVKEVQQQNDYFKNTQHKGNYKKKNNYQKININYTDQTAAKYISHFVFNGIIQNKKSRYDIIFNFTIQC